MNKKLAFKIAIVVLLIGSAILACGPCLIEEVAFTDQRDMAILFERMKSVSPFGVNFASDSTCSYYPELFGIITVIELVLVFLKGKLIRFAGIVLNMAKAVAPILIYNLKIVDEFGGARYHVYYPSIFGYILFAVCLITMILYAVDMAIKE